MQQVKECMMVTMEYRLKTTDGSGEVNEAPPMSCSFVYGVDPQYRSVELAIADKQPGDRVLVHVPPEEIFGVYDESLVRELPSSDYKKERVQAGKMYRQIRKKTLVQFMVKEVRDDVIVADFNDPRAGTSAEFDIVIRDVREATKVEMQPSCAKA
ncbi:MAG: hypothetical protein HGB17_15220 [Syntrophobacteraceae bacterium]|nr:hypothetical protein [Syntrophobacteraceae bacterium]